MMKITHPAYTELAIPGLVHHHDRAASPRPGQWPQRQYQKRRPLYLACASSNSNSSATASSSGDINGRGGGVQLLTETMERSDKCLQRELAERFSLTGDAYDFTGATKPLIQEPLKGFKNVFLVRHGLSSWNEDSRIQGSSDLSILSEKGVLQALKCKAALQNLKFDQCFASPISRAKSMAELIWDGRNEHLVFSDSLKEAHLHFLEGMRNEDAKMQYPEIYRAWREDPANFCIEGVYPVVDLWDRAVQAWREILSAEGQRILVVTHKSILRAMVCTALGMGPKRFRAVDINNGGICSFKINEKGEPLLYGLNMTAHLYVDSFRY
ncbi:hypothetical protein KP509_29G049100 [Ceratopteris richardii]|uniref:2-carboxy-D-arabinitol-1-phosphatase n=1 Tax=Ceratopteris richardii TaxID=49495 RepID=A0A8T2R6T3_CERRI|nr:hypothetical protein KP509_29G049100 [Ceratopteris richardii]